MWPVRSAATVKATPPAPPDIHPMPPSNEQMQTGHLLSPSMMTASPPLVLPDLRPVTPITEQMTTRHIFSPVETTYKEPLPGMPPTPMPGEYARLRAMDPVVPFSPAERYHLQVMLLPQPTLPHPTPRPTWSTLHRHHPNPPHLAKPTLPTSLST